MSELNQGFPVVASYPKPAGLLIRFASSFIDAIIFSLFTILSFTLIFPIKSPLLGLLLVTLLSIPGLLYKPFMESYYGATLGKMACGIQVIDGRGQKLSLGAAYVRYSPFLIQAAIGLASTVWYYLRPEHTHVSGFMEMGQLMSRSPFALLTNIWNWVIIADCLTVLFNKRKRAVHDMMAGSYCVWKSDSKKVSPEI